MPDPFPHTNHFLSSLFRQYAKPGNPSSPTFSASTDRRPSEVEAATFTGPSSFRSESNLHPDILPGETARVEFREKVLGLLKEDDEDGLKDVLKKQLGIHNDTTLDQHILTLMHTLRDDNNNVPFFPSALTPRRNSSRSIAPTLAKTIPRRPFTAISSTSSPSALTSALPTSNSFTEPTLLGSSPSKPSFVRSGSLSSSSPSTLLASLPSETLSPLSSPRPLSAKAIEFKPSPRLPVAIPFASVANAASVDWSVGASARSSSPYVLSRSSSNLAIAAPILSVSPSRPSPFAIPSSIGHPRIDDEEDEEEDQDDFSPFGTSLPRGATPFYSGQDTLAYAPTGEADGPSWQDSSSSSYSSSFDPTFDPDNDFDAVLQEEELDSTLQMTPLDVLGSIFTSLTPHELEVALHKYGYDLELTIRGLLGSTAAPGQINDSSTTYVSTLPSASLSAANAPKPFVPKEGYVVAGGRNGGIPVVPPSNALNSNGSGLSKSPGVANNNSFGGRVCRYYLNGECRRADCRFSHDIERALCRFWLRGQCAKGDQCEFIHNLPSTFDATALSQAVSNINLSHSEASLRPESKSPTPPPEEDFPQLGAPTMSKKASGPAKHDASRTRFSSAVKKPAVAPVPIHDTSAATSSSGGKATLAGLSSANGINSISSNLLPVSTPTPTSRPSPRLNLRAPSLLPTLPTGSSLNQMYLSARSRAIQLGMQRNVCLAKAAEAWKKKDGAGAKKFSQEGQALNELMTIESAEAAGKLVRERRRIAQEAARNRQGWSSDPLDRSRKGKECAAGLGVILGVASSTTAGAAGLTSGEREEALLDLHALHGTEAVDVLERFLIALEGESFLGLAYAIVGEQKHTGTQDAARGSSKIRLSASVKTWLAQWDLSLSLISPFLSRNSFSVDPLPTTSFGSAAHQPRRRHHHRAGLSLTARDSCEVGSFECDGSTLKQCATSGKWVTLQVCSADTVCNASNSVQANIGCVWPDQVGGNGASVSTVATTAQATATTSAAQTTSGAGTGTGTASLVASASSSSSSSTKTKTKTHWWDTTTTSTGTSTVVSAGSSSTAWAQGTTSAVSATASGTATTSGASVASSTASSSSGTSSSSASRWVVYSDYPVMSQPPSSAELGDITHFILAFWLVSEGAYDNAAAWVSMSDSDRAALKADYAANGKYLMVSAFGSTDTPTTSGYDPTQTAQKLAAFVEKYDLDGVDIDYEDFPAFTSGTAMPWLITFQQALRAALPSPYLISHAPVAPWFTSASTYADGGYRGVYSSAGSGIDFFNVQFYNQGSSEYTDCQGLLYTSSSTYPGSSLFEIANQGIPIEKLLIGKPSTSAQASNGYMSSDLMASCLSEALSTANASGGSLGGVMYWQWESRSSSDVFKSLVAAV
ncbi:Polyadenylation factor I complex, subunit, Yth1 (CPSF subunit) [Phaffia rhodozyma]|uniref:Polyadenylation factor I complex, subunit, Yth1 (CPSF subunit) n=1 Tax=Phaffia rhodozyma TaxID=264483 RepID=A0A0F7SG45_PHARH|nr:Polyadenylation factor I complex, subunit, Yth1 (CPSF subunit) [Phaffia rhodozyma]